ncbi:hypothetical protein M8C21_023547 [Ambrosia artemisiifolia]|uniref:Uncharacterized protein n=1 Tax=Ambrosia artemisiifolia TaxID=4212 RepID=A0AAD5CYX7_AMBAR|nr:hypothetical protein M8C21_023547 [Ambrosia artemisiifolia]
MRERDFSVFILLPPPPKVHILLHLPNAVTIHHLLHLLFFASTDPRWILHLGISLFFSFSWTKFIYRCIILYKSLINRSWRLTFILNREKNDFAGRCSSVSIVCMFK